MRRQRDRRHIALGGAQRVAPSGFDVACLQTSESSLYRDAISCRPNLGKQLLGAGFMHDAFVRQALNEGARDGGRNGGDQVYPVG
jgi:hypothetical protein